MNQDKLKNILKEVLTDLEIQVYLASLSGSLTISELAKKADLNRSGTYRIVENLISKGLLIREITPTSQKIIAEHPKKVQQLIANQQRKLRRKELDWQDLLPEVLSEYNIEQTNKPRVQVFENQDGLENAYNLMLDECKNTKIQALSGDLELVLQVFDLDFWNNWNTKIFAKNNSAQMIVNDSRQAREFKSKNDSKNFTTKIIPNFKLQTDINIFNDKVLIVSFKDKMATLITSKFIANSYRILFETIWKK